MTDIKTHIEGTANFVYFRDSALWYRTDSGFLFPVPLDDIGTTTFEASYKGIKLMRWIRKAMTAQSEARQELETLTRGDLQ